MAFRDGEVRIRKLGTPKRDYRWLGTYKPDGAGGRTAKRSFKTRTAAETFARDWQARTRREGALELSDHERWPHGGHTA